MQILFFPPNKPELVRRVEAALPELTVKTAENEDAMAAAIASTDILVTGNRPYTASAARTIREKGGRLKLIHFTTSGIDTALKHGLPEGVPVTNSAGTHSNRIGQHAIALLLALTRCLNDAQEARRRREWIHDSMQQHMISLERATMALIGVGAVGQEIARKAKAFDMRVIGVSRSSAPLPNIDEIRPRARLRETLQEADVVALATVYDDTTHHMLNADTLSVLKPRAIIVNVARGLLIDEVALIDTLRAGRIRGIGMDVMAVEPLPADSPLWSLPNVVMTPHTANGGGDGQVEGIFNIIRENLKRMTARQGLMNRVHGPELAPLPA